VTLAYSTFEQPGFPEPHPTTREAVRGAALASTADPHGDSTSRYYVAPDGHRFRVTTSLEWNLAQEALAMVGFNSTATKRHILEARALRRRGELR
jgi:hypothetical protein